VKWIIYLAGGLFNAPERLHNLYLEKHLKALGCEVILPQREALKRFNGQTFDVAGIVRDCSKTAQHADVLVVASADGPDADSGTSIEYGMAIAKTGRAIVYRTDFRTDREREIGFNAMFSGEGTVFVYKPCFFTELEQVEEFYAGLAKEIHEACLGIHNRLAELE